MNVTPPKSWGKLAGTVTGKDCKGNTHPLQGAQVQANGRDFTFSPRDLEGRHVRSWFDASGGPITGYRQQGRVPGADAEGEHQGRRDDDRQLRAQGSLLAHPQTLGLTTSRTAPRRRGRSLSWRRRRRLGEAASQGYRTQEEDEWPV